MAPLPEIPVEISISLLIYPTESEDSLRALAFSLFNDIPLERVGNSLSGRSSSLSDLEKIRQKIFEKRVLDTFRSRLIANSSEGSTFILLHRQALAVGRIALVDSPEESPLGPFRISLSSPSLPELINWLSPKTQEGVPVRAPGQGGYLQGPLAERNLGEESETDCNGEEEEDEEREDAQ